MKHRRHKQVYDQERQKKHRRGTALITSIEEPESGDRRYPIPRFVRRPFEAGAAPGLDPHEVGPRRFRQAATPDRMSRQNPYRHRHEGDHSLRPEPPPYGLESSELKAGLVAPQSALFPLPRYRAPAAKTRARRIQAPTTLNGRQPVK